MPSNLQSTQIAILDLDSDVITVSGIKSVELSFVDQAYSVNLSLWYNETTRQVYLTTTDSTVFVGSVLSSPVLFSMTITDDSLQCTRLGDSYHGPGCTSVFLISLQALTVDNCPLSISVIVPASASTGPPVVWSEPNLLAEFPFISNFQPGDVFPIGTTLVRYELDGTVQSPLQSVESFISCQFEV